MRDFEQRPYSPDEERVARFLAQESGLGGGDDPIGFLMASHQFAIESRNLYAEEREQLSKRIAVLEIQANRLKEQRDDAVAEVASQNEDYDQLVARYDTVCAQRDGAFKQCGDLSDAMIDALGMARIGSKEQGWVNPDDTAIAAYARQMRELFVEGVVLAEDRATESLGREIYDAWQALERHGSTAEIVPSMNRQTLAEAIDLAFGGSAQGDPDVAEAVSV